MQTEQRRWVRRTNRRLVAGVAGGLADNTGTHPIWWRLAFVVMTLAGGLGVLIYLLLWWLVPRADLQRSAGQRFAAHFPGAPAWLGIGLLMFGAVLLAGQLGLWTPNVGWAFLLIGLGVVLYRREAERNGGEGAAKPIAGSSTQVAPPSWTAVDEDPPPPWEGFPAAPPPLAPSPGRPKRERSPLGWLAFGLALAATGVLWMLQDSGAFHPTLAQLFALPLALLGAGLLVGAFIGHARLTILPGLLLVPIVLFASLITVPLTGRWDARYVTPRTSAQLRQTYEQSGGNLVFDFTALQPGQHPGPVQVTVGIGGIRVGLRKGTPVSITAAAGFGDLRILGNERAGFGASETFSTPGADQVVLDLQVDVGTIEVFYQVPPPSAPRNGKANG